MRIFHINCNYIGTALHRIMVNNLGKLGYDNQVYVPTYDKNLSVIEIDENVCVSECFNKWDRLVFDYKQAKIYNDVVSKFNLSDFDCIHAYTLFTDGNCARKLSEKYGVPYVVAVRNTDVNAFFRTMPHLRSRGVAVMRNAQAVFFLSEAYRDEVLSKYVPRKYRDELLEKTFIIPNGIDDFWLENAPETVDNKGVSQKIRLVYAGRIDKNKNIRTTQKSMDILRKKGYSISLTVVGKVADKSEFEAVIKDKFTDYIPNQKKEGLLQIYRDCDIFVMPSFTESFGLVYAEAMSQGLPIVYSKGQGFDGHFPDGSVGYRVDSHSAEDVADAIEKIVCNYPTVSSKTIAAAHKFNWSQIVRKYDKIYKEIK
ncbi:MAG: glycosyltransferase family 4 protein [Clostridia bacterium]|nr:glycosyltransferase family 4 protein [Clostridia bacterium]